MLNFLKVFFCFFLYLCLTLHVSSKEKAMNKLEAINHMINESGLSYSAIAKKADVSREQLYRWKNAEVSDPSSDSLFAIADALGYIVQHHNTKNLKLIKESNTGDNAMIEEHKDYMLDTQRKLLSEYENKIQKLEIENKVLEASNSNAIESVLFEKLEYHWMTTVDIKVNLIKGVTRRIYDLQNIGSLADALETDIDTLLPFFDTKNTYKMNQHPVNKIITKESLQGLQHKTETFLDIIKDGVQRGQDTLDFFLGNHYITLFINYELNNKTCKTITHCKMIKKGINTLTIQNKIQFLHN
jgi:transcriptional regulator with XRE-family HTH domain